VAVRSQIGSASLRLAAAAWCRQEAIQSVGYACIWSHHMGGDARRDARIRVAQTAAHVRQRNAIDRAVTTIERFDVVEPVEQLEARLASTPEDQA
jgi:hypothetical protein